MNEEQAETQVQRPQYEKWAVLEVMGQRRYAGRLTVEWIGDRSYVRIEVPAKHGGVLDTLTFGHPAVYCITPVSEAEARALAARWHTERRWQWELNDATQQVLAMERVPDDYPDVFEGQ